MGLPYKLEQSVKLEPKQLGQWHGKSTVHLSSFIVGTCIRCLKTLPLLAGTQSEAGPGGGRARKPRSEWVPHGELLDSCLVKVLSMQQQPFPSVSISTSSDPKSMSGSCTYARRQPTLTRSVIALGNLLHFGLLVELPGAVCFLVITGCTRIHPPARFRSMLKRNLLGSAVRLLVLGWNNSPAEQSFWGQNLLLKPLFHVWLATPFCCCLITALATFLVCH